MLRVTGEVVRYERLPWNMDGRSGIARKARVLVGKADFVDVTYPDNLPEPREGDRVDVGVIASTPAGKLRFTVRGDWAALVGSEPTPLSAVHGL